MAQRSLATPLFFTSGFRSAVTTSAARIVRVAVGARPAATAARITRIAVRHAAARVTAAAAVTAVAARIVWIAVRALRLRALLRRRRAGEADGRRRAQR